MNSRSPTVRSSQRSTRESLQLIRHVSLALPADVKASIDQVVTYFEGHLPEQDSSEIASGDGTSDAFSISQHHSSRYLGEGSDIRFLSLAKDTFVDATSPDVAAQCIDSYDQEETSLPFSPLISWVSEAPSWRDGERYMTTYFYTIHIAYPFLPRSYFISKVKASLFENTRNDQLKAQLTASWLSLFYGVLAIGAFYDYLANQGQSTNPSADLHAQYFRRSVLLTNVDKLEASAVQVSALLVQCFYLLATSNTDRCWITLGIAIRLAQALGLHMDFAGGTRAWSYPLPVSQRIEIRRRVWYSLYVMDRLIALQVGRPPALSDSGFSVSLPSNFDDVDHDWEADRAFPEASEPSSGSYFLHAIELSRIIGQVVQELNEPPKAAEVRLLRINGLDRELSQWKQSLPYYLRFDVVHLFDKSPYFKRQRIMLAMEYHHLRALMYRQYLSLPRSSSVMAESQTDSQTRWAQWYGAICISEACQTAHLFRDVQDTCQLIFDYPWWQLISCIVCAASILVVAGTLQQPAEEATKHGRPCDDAEACLKVLDALSSRSPGARRARDSIAKLLSLCSTFTDRMTTEGRGGRQHRNSCAMCTAESGVGNGYAEEHTGAVYCPTDGGLGELETSRDSHFSWLDGGDDPVTWWNQLLSSMVAPTSFTVPTSFPEPSDVAQVKPDQL